MDKPKTMREMQFELRTRRFVERICAGDSETEAYLVSHKKAKRLDERALAQAASRFSNQPQVKAALRQAIRSLPVENILNAAEHAKTLVYRAKTAFDEKNYTASSAYDRIIAQANGMVRENQVINNTWKIADADLLKQMAGDDPIKQAAVRTLLGSDSFNKPPESDKTGPDRPDQTTKH